ncbi:mannitol dehydrogenase family protein [Lactiplantibacillus modestisalitolerans]|uniref:Mannitol dehydrogenase family protein n=1 Tax=Lactiplantibacillus modestisalitolerans TaxID=1457219 RepID=A0ABV5WTG0_9LACO|nr:mannitol dehydrogenase family protein [Lactiplantibacillus modestisalitolerans]
MVKITDNYLTQADAFQAANIQVPTYDQAQLKKDTQAHPRWVHFGGGNLFRAFHAAIANRLIEKGELDAGVIVAETYDEDVVKDIYDAYDHRILRVITKADGNFEQELFASVAEAHFFSPDHPTDWQRMFAIFEQASLQVVTFSITEKGYNLRTGAGDLNDLTKADIVAGPKAPKGNMAGLVALLYGRYQHGQLPLALLSTDNFSQNGDRLKDSVLTIAKGWLSNGFVDDGFLAYLQDPTKISFPLSMIDRITPNPAKVVGDKLAAAGFEDSEILHTPKHTNIAAFTNTEAVHYLVVEDAFPNGRPKFEDAGVIVTDRATVNDADEMKVTTCLNPLHTALAILGNVLGYKSIASELQNADLVKLLKQIGYVEGLPVVTDPKVIDPKTFIDQLLQQRLPNPYIPDTPQRIATDTSQKMAIRYGVTIKHYQERAGLDPQKLEFIPLVIAAWFRYLMAVQDDGQAFTPSPDPLLADLQKHVADIQLGQPTDVAAHLQPVLKNASIFGVDLVAAGLAPKIEAYFTQMIAGTGAVTATLKQALADHAQVVRD